MPRQIIIENGEARVIEQSVVAVASLDGLRDHLSVRVPSVMPVLPQNVAGWAYDPDNSKFVLITRRAPGIENVTVYLDESGEVDGGVDDDDLDRAEEDTGRATFRIKTPWLYFVWYLSEVAGVPDHFTITDSKIYCSKHRVVRPTDRVRPFRMPNLYGDGTVCWGSVYTDQQTLAERIDARTTSFFNTHFNMDLGNYLPGNLESWSAWERQSAEHEYPHLEWTWWNDAGYTTFARLLDPHTDNIPEPIVHERFAPPPPPNFTVGRAREWARGLPAGARTRLLAAIRDELAEEVPA